MTTQSLQQKIEEIFDKHRVAYTTHGELEVDFDINVINTHKSTNDLLSLFKQTVEEEIIGEDIDQPDGITAVNFYRHGEDKEYRFDHPNQLRASQRQKLQEIVG